MARASRYARLALREKLSTPRPESHSLAADGRRTRPAVSTKFASSRKSIRWFMQPDSKKLWPRTDALLPSPWKPFRRICCGKPSGCGTSDEHLAQIWKTTPAVVRLQRAPVWRCARVQARGHLRRRIRVVHPVHVLDVRGRGRSRHHAKAEIDDPGQRPQPHRAGN